MTDLPHRISPVTGLPVTYDPLLHGIDVRDLPGYRPPRTVPLPVHEPALGSRIERTRAEAMERRWKRYYTGQPCRRGHLSDRYVRGGACIECVRPTINHRVGRYDTVMCMQPRTVVGPAYVSAEMAGEFYRYLREAACTFWTHHHPELAKELREETDWLNTDLIQR